MIAQTVIGDTGRTVVFLHGLLGQGKNFTATAKALQPEYRSVLLDLPNHGRSSWTESIDYLDLADRVADHLRAHLTTDLPVHLIGHSMGGKVAMVLAQRHPDLVDRLVIADISPTVSENTDEFEHLLDSLLSLDLAALRRRADAERALTTSVTDARVRGFLLQNLRAEDAGYAWQANLALLRRSLDAISDFPVISTTFTHPVLWIAGELSDYVQPEHEPIMRAIFPRSTLVTIKRAGHWVHSEQPDAFATALRVFFNADRPGPQG